MKVASLTYALACGPAFSILMPLARLHAWRFCLMSSFLSRFEGLEGQKIGFERLEWLGNERSCCHLELTRL